jgi:hypothetical protein
MKAGRSAVGNWHSFGCCSQLQEGVVGNRIANLATAMRANSTVFGCAENSTADHLTFAFLLRILAFAWRTKAQAERGIPCFH